MSNSLDKAWLKYHDEHELADLDNEELAIARLAFKAGYEAAQQNVQRTGRAWDEKACQEAVDRAHPRRDRKPLA